MRLATLPVLLLALASAAGDDPPAQEVRLHFVLSRRPHGTEPERDRLRELEEELLVRLEAKRAGRLARDRWDDGVCVVTLDGPDAWRIWAVVEQAVRSYGPRPGSYAVLRAGGRDAPEERVPLDPPEPEPKGPTPPR